jgi:hypothetical protein
MFGLAGGSGMRPMAEAGSANWNGDGIAGAGITMGDAGSANLQILAGMAGGKRRRRGMRGGTTKVSLMPQSLAETGSPLAAALTH